MIKRVYTSEQGELLHQFDATISEIRRERKIRWRQGEFIRRLLEKDMLDEPDLNRLLVTLAALDLNL